MTFPGHGAAETVRSLAKQLAQNYAVRYKEFMTAHAVEVSSVVSSDEHDAFKAEPTYPLKL